MVAFVTFGQGQHNVAATGILYTSDLALAAMKFANHCADIALGRDKKNLVIRFDDGITARNERMVVAVNGHHSGINPGQMLVQGTEPLAHQWTASVGFDGD